MCALLLSVLIVACDPASEPPGTATSAPTSAPTTATTVRTGTTSRRAIALMFDATSDDDGAERTRAILGTLRDENIRATFAVGGLWAENHPADLLAIAADGHRLMNGTYSARSFTGASTSDAPLTAADRRLELQRTETTVYRISNRSTRGFFHPPYGDIDEALPAEAASAGYDYIVLPTIDTSRWFGAGADAIVARVLAEAAPGAIIAMRAFADDAAILPALIARLRDEGYAFETIDEIVVPE